MPDPLNPVLYRKLSRMFGAVRINNEGEGFVARTTKTADGRLRTLIDQEGEYYRVSCPFCTDTRSRLYVNHMFGMRGPAGGRMRFLAFCFNENCLATPDNYDRFVADLDIDERYIQARVRPGVVVPESQRKVMPPGRCVPMSSLPATHPAARYLAGRRFDVDCWDAFSVHYCEESHYFLAKHRIIVPVHESGRLVGWQARYPGELPWKDPAKKKDLPPKYFNCPNAKFRSRSVYNLDSMRQWETGVLVEGVTDVWRGGSMFGCVFGNTVTAEQRKKLVRAFRRRRLVLCLDPEEYESRSTREIVNYFSDRLGGRNFCAVRLPEGTDPGGLDRTFLKEYVREQAAERGVKVVYRRRKE